MSTPETDNHSYTDCPDNTATIPATPPTPVQQKDLVSDFAKQRLGVASSLLLALASKHRPTAMHSIRVGLGLSGWARYLKLDDATCRNLEIAGVLHDLGKIGVPDSILQKPGSLGREEMAMVDYHRQNVMTILQPSLVSQDIAEAIYYSIAFYDGSKSEFNRKGESLPANARMLAIADAYDSMTMESRYRGARTPAKAVAELFQMSDSQFDRKLVTSFAKYVDTRNVWTSDSDISSWLAGLASLPSESHWSINSGNGTVGQFVAERAYQKSLLESVEEGCIFLDLYQKVMLWNRAAADITGLASLDILDRKWPKEMLELKDDYNLAVPEDESPITRCIETKQPQTLSGSIMCGDQRRNIALRTVPVFSPRGVLMGITVVLRDQSSEKNLKQRLKSMTIAATTDPLTQVANRAEFDRVFSQYLQEHREQKAHMCVIFADIDFFKRINDDYSHEAGDKALASFAAHLTRHCRPEDLVARFGGEEFVIICPETDISSATDRAETIRSTLQSLPQPMLKNRCISASFGVAELQEGDTPSSLLRRADRALMKAKKDGRNRVVCLAGNADLPEPIEKEAEPPASRSFLSWLLGNQNENAGYEFEKKLVTSVPVDIVIEKIRGFISDFNASIESTEANSVVFTLDSTQTNVSRRANDRPAKFRLNLRVEEPEDPIQCADTLIFVSIAVLKPRDRRNGSLAVCLEEVYRSLRSYLVAKEFGEREAGNLEPAATRPGEGRE